MIDIQNGWFKVFNDYRNSEIYKIPACTLVFIELCYRYNKNISICFTELRDALLLAKATLSNALKILRETGFIVEEKKGIFKYYKINVENGNLEHQVQKLNLTSSNIEPIDEQQVQNLNPVSSKIEPIHLIDNKNIIKNIDDDIEKIFEEFLTNQENVQRLAKNNNIQITQLFQIVNEIKHEWTITEVKHHSRSDMLKHLVATIRIKARILKQSQNADNKQQSFADGIQQLLFDRSQGKMQGDNPAIWE